MSAFNAHTAAKNRRQEAIAIAVLGLSGLLVAIASVAVDYITDWRRPMFLGVAAMGGFGFAMGVVKLVRRQLKGGL